MSEKPALGLLKCYEVKTGQKVLLDVKKSTTFSGVSSAPATGYKTAQCQQTAVIKQNGEDFAIIEITCECGKKTTVKCNYAK